jgi:eukaryotic-like serine/threonine-protein kinase
VARDESDITEFLTPPGDLSTQELPHSDVVAPGTKIGEYVVERPIGHGGMGAVYLAHHPIIEKRAAIKLLSGRVEERLVERLVNEARAVNRIRHEHIVDVFSFGRLTDGRPYIVMEYLDGEPLEMRLSRGPVSLQEAFAIVEQMADALEATHRVGIVHRDLKPANVFLVRRARRQPTVKLLDFGVAKLGSDGQSEVATAEGIVVGTPAYLAPEQAASRPVSAATDVYALGVILFEMVAGQRPFHGSSSVEIASKHLHETPPRASEVGAVLPAAVDDLIARMLAKEPARRPGLAEVRRMAAVVAAGTLVAAPPPPRRRRALAVVAAVGAIAIAAALGWLLPRSDTDQKSRPVTPPIPTPTAAPGPAVIPEPLATGPVSEPAPPAAEPAARKKASKKKKRAGRAPEPATPADAPIDPLSGMRR